jgi:hypothetical protein
MERGRGRGEAVCGAADGAPFVTGIVVALVDTRNNRSAFFCRLRFRTKSAMAEILVSNLCDRRPPLLIGGFFRCREERGPLLFFSLFFPVFLAVLYCFVSIAFFIAITRPYIVFCRFSPL